MWRWLGTMCGIWLGVASVVGAQDVGVAGERDIHLGEVVVNRQDRTVSFPVTVVDNGFALEYLLVTEGGKEYEAILSTPARGEHIHAAMLLMGLAPGIPARQIGQDVIPPKGATVSLRVYWDDAAGTRQEADPLQWIRNVKSSTPPENSTMADGAPGQAASESLENSWVFVGSEILPNGAYAADEDTGIISMTNIATAVFDVPFLSSRSMDDRLFESDRTKMPPVGTKMTMVITPDSEAERSPYARALLEINPWGQMRMDGGLVEFDQLQDWADQFVRKHLEAMVVIRLFPETPAGYAVLAQMELKLGGVFHFDREIVTPSEMLLPRTDAQRLRRLAEWKATLANPQEALVPPVEEVQREIQRTELQRKTLEQQLQLLEAYSKDLQDLLADSPHSGASRDVDLNGTHSP